MPWTAAAEFPSLWRDTLKGKHRGPSLSCLATQQLCIDENLICVRVYVKVGSEQNYSPCLQMVLTEEHQEVCASETKVKVPGGCSFCQNPSNCITWCKTELVS